MLLTEGELSWVPKGPLKWPWSPTEYGPWVPVVCSILELRLKPRWAGTVHRLPSVFRLRPLETHFGLQRRRVCFFRPWRSHPSQYQRGGSNAKERDSGKTFCGFPLDGTGLIGTLIAEPKGPTQCRGEAVVTFGADAR